MSVRKRNWFWIILHAVFMCVAGGMILGTLLYVRHVNTYGYTYEMGNFSTKYDLSLNVVKEWGEAAHGYRYGMQYDGVIYNLTDENVNDWVIRIEFIEGCKVDSYWNGTITFEDNVMIMEANSYNKVVQAHNSQPFGFVLHADHMDNIVSCSVTFRNPISVTDIFFFWPAVVILFSLVVVDITLLFVRNREKELYERERIAQRIIDQSFETFANIIDAKDPYTKGHSMRVAWYAREIARRMGFSKEEQKRIYMIGSVHDIGKVGVPDAILQKSGKLTPEEREKVQQHVVKGAEILKDFTAVEGIVEGAKYHHERYDGTGYGEGLAGEEIPLFARIIGVADSFDAMSSTRCYRPKLTIETIVEELKRCTGSQFDPQIVTILLDMIEEGVAPTQHVE